MAQPWGAWSTAAPRDWKLQRRSCRSTWTGGVREPRSSPASAMNPTRCGFCPACSRAEPRAHPSPCWCRMKISARATMKRSRTGFARVTPTTPISRNTAFATIAAAAVPRRARPWCGWRPVRLRVNFCASASASASTAIWRSWGRSSCCRSIRPPRMKIPSFVRIRRASKNSRISFGEIREAGDSIGARVTVIA